MNKTTYYLVLAVFLLWGSCFKASAQVTIGAATPPEAYSVLELSATNTKGGLRMPHLTTTERDALGFTSGSGTVPNQGLTIYNTTTKCIEYWNNSKWVSLCLGTANITLKSECGDYDGANPPVAEADGTASNCKYTPMDSPACTVQSGQAYQVYLTAGDAYTFLTVDNLTSDFSLTFSENNSSMPRNAIVRVVNNCSGEFQDFIFVQKGAICPDVPKPVLNAETLSLCKGGSAIAYVKDAKPGAKYIWTYAGVVVHTGLGYEINRAGTYLVYPGLLGCGEPTKLIVNEEETEAPLSVRITATNSGILCNGGNVILSAETTQNVEWYHDGIPHSSTNNPLTVSGAAAAGEWFAVVKDGVCTSTSSNVLSLLDQTDGSSALESPKMLIDGLDISSSEIPTFCQNSSIWLEIGNAANYPAGVFFEWFINGISQGVTTNKTLIYNIPSNINTMSVSVQASNHGVNCPSTAVAATQEIKFTAPAGSNINNKDAKAFICGGSPAVLKSNVQNGVLYEWYLDNEPIATTQIGTYEATVLGSYKVRYQDEHHCWSKFSPSIIVENSSVISMAWSMEPGDDKDEVIYDATQSYSVQSAPVAESYTWKALRADGVTEIPMYTSANGSVATITYPNLGTEKETITISVTGKNGCGETTISKTVTLRSGCVPVTSASITPAGTTSLAIGEKMTFTAFSAGATNFVWKIDGAVVGGNDKDFEYTATKEGTYALSVTTSGCEGSATANATIEVKPDTGGIPEEGTNGNYTLQGKSCYDVNQADHAQCGPTSGRKNDFASTKTFYYTLVHTTAVSDVKFYVDDNSGALKQQGGYVVNDNVLTLNFKDNIEQYIVDNGSAVITITVVYKNATGEWRKIVREVKIQDCSCCGAYVSATVWKVFKCHNLGADENADPFILNQSTNGNYYKWASKTVWGTAYSDEKPANWESNTAPSGSWSGSDGKKTANDPCPTGFRVPTKTDFEGILKEADKNPQSIVGTFTNGDKTNFGAGKYFGPGLLLPAAGYRTSSDGTTTSRSNRGLYWTSTGGSGAGYCLFFTQDRAYVDRQSGSFAYSVRCVAE